MRVFPGRPTASVKNGRFPLYASAPGTFGQGNKTIFHVADIGQTMKMVSEPSRLSQAVKLILPREHGSWSLALEPVAFGMLAAPSTPGLALAAAAISGLFLRRPLKL